MSKDKTTNQTTGNQADGHAGEQSGTDHTLDAAAEQERLDRLAEIARLAAAGELEAPAGAEEIVEALAMAAQNRDEARDAVLRGAADLQNFRRRASLNEQEARRQGMTGVIQSVVTVMDHFDLALTQDPSKTSAEQIMSGVQVIKDQLLNAMRGHGVEPIAPDAGEEFDPMKHEAIMRQPAEDVEPGRVIITLQAGYALGDRVLRPAKVSVAVDEAAGGA